MTYLSEHLSAGFMQPGPLATLGKGFVSIEKHSYCYYLLNQKKNGYQLITEA